MFVGHSLADPDWTWRADLLLVKFLLSVSMKKLIIAISAVMLVLAVLFVFYPMLRTVEPQTITYNTVYVGTIEQNMTLTSTNNAFALWEETNPELVFKKGSGGMTIVFTPCLLPRNDGLAICPFWSNSEDGCYVFASLDVINRYQYPANKNYLTNTLAHEIGHVLGMMHADTNDNLMFGLVLGWNFDDRGFEVPERLEPDA